MSNIEQPREEKTQSPSNQIELTCNTSLRETHSRELSNEIEVSQSPVPFSPQPPSKFRNHYNYKVQSSPTPVPLTNSSRVALLPHVHVHRPRRKSLNNDREKRRIPTLLKWENINYSISVNDPTKKGCCKSKVPKQILFNINGIAKPGQLLAIMGPSGSGESCIPNPPPLFFFRTAQCTVHLATTC